MKGVKTVVEYQGEFITLSEAIKRSGSTVAPRQIHRRLEDGWPLMRALTLAPGGNKPSAPVTLRQIGGG